jgi:hypothetical protein
VRPRTLLVLLVVVVALGAFIRFYERDLPSSDERARLAKKILDFKKEQVTRLRLVADGTTVVLERVPPPQPAKAASAAAAGKIAAPPVAEAPAPAAEWRIVRPLAARADADAVDRLLDSLSNLEKARTLEKVVPAEVGLDKPRAVVGLTVSGQRGETVLDVGAAVPTGGQAIVAIAGRPQAYVVGDSQLTDVRKKPGDWRDRQIFRGSRDAVVRLAWTVGGGPRVLLAKRGDRFWLESPISDRADRDQVEKLLSDLTGLSAESFLDLPPPAPAAPPSGGAAAASSASRSQPPPPSGPALGLEPPRAVLEAFLAGQPQPVRVELGASHAAAAPPAASPDQPAAAPEAAAAGKLTWARSGGATFETRSPLAETLSRPPADWRSPVLSGLEVHQVDSAVVRDDQGATPLTRSGTDWKRGGVTISYLPVSDLLFSLLEAKADRLLTPAEAAALRAGAGKPLLTFELKGGQAGNETLTLYPPLAPLSGATHGVPARASGRDTVLLLPESKLKEIQDRLAAVRTAKPAIPEKVGKE